MNALPHLQSLVIVLLKVLLLNFTALLTAPGQPTTTNNSGSNGNGNNTNNNHNDSNRIAPSVLASELTSGVIQAKDAEGRPNETAVDGEDREVEKSPPLTVEQADTARTRETESKVVSALLLLLLRWFKVSRTVIPSAGLPSDETFQILIITRRSQV